MKRFEFSKEELEYIMDTLELVLKDIENIYFASELSELIIDFRPYESYDTWTLKATSSGIVIKTNEWNNLASFYNTFGKRKSSYQNKLELWTNLGHNNLFHFLAEYSTIRPELVKKATHGNVSKETIFKRLKTLRTNFTDEVYVDLGTKESQNRHYLDVKKENGQTVGTINFGQKTVKIITDGEIILTHTKPIEEKAKSLT